jgi:hypothetical protein
MRVRRLILPVILLLALAAGGLMLGDYVRRHPEKMPWTALDLRQPIGGFTGRKLAALGEDPARYRVLLTQAGARFTALPARNEGPQCGHDDAVRLTRAGALPGDVGTACAVAAALLVWEREIVQPAARRHFGRPVAAIDHYGSYSCRRLYGREDGGWSEHARANALDMPASASATGPGSRSPPTGAIPAPGAASCARSATAPAVSSPPCSRPITTPRTATISISTRRAEGAAGGRAGDKAGDPYGNRTRVSAVKGPRPNR